MSVKSESQFQTWFSKWLSSEKADDFRSLYVGLVYELKVVRVLDAGGKKERWSLPPSAFKSHQIPELLRAVGLGGEGSGFLSHKISDSALGYKPCDGFALWGGGGKAEAVAANWQKLLLRAVEGGDGGIGGKSWDAGSWYGAVGSYVAIGEVFGSYAWFVPSWVVATCYGANKRVTLELCASLCGRFGVFKVCVRSGEVTGIEQKKN